MILHIYNEYKKVRMEVAILSYMSASPHQKCLWMVLSSLSVLTLICSLHWQVIYFSLAG